MTLQNRPCSALVAAEFDQPASASQIRRDQCSPAVLATLFRWLESASCISAVSPKRMWSIFRSSMKRVWMGSAARKR